jgi:peptidoglycan/LPS O-acetylase OafA/YrhL
MQNTEAATAPERPRYGNFDILRLFLALEVLYNHVWMDQHVEGKPWLPIPAVPCFIAISGMFVPQSFEHSVSTKHFFWKRFLRTIPALVPLLFFTMIVLGRATAAGTVLYYLSYGYLGNTNNSAPLWSLGVEDALYILMVGAFALGFYKKTWPLILLLAFCQFLYTQHLDPTAVYRFVDTTASFLVGSILYLERERFKNLHWAFPLVALVICVALYVPLKSAGIVFLTLIPTALLTAMRLPQIRIQIPNLSYGVYIWHVFVVFSLERYLWDKMNPNMLPTVLTATLVIAVLSWYLVEKPALRYKNWILRREPTPVPGAS